MKNAILTIVILSSLTCALPASAADKDWKELSGLAFKSIDDDRNGAITRSEYSNFGDEVFVSMDGDSSGSLSLSEFYTWGFGLHDTAEKAGQTEAFKTAMRVVFALWDRNADGQIAKVEYQQSLNLDFLRADLNEDKSLTEKEYRSGFSVIVAAQAAITPQTIRN